MSGAANGGMCCPKCGKDTCIVDSRKRGDYVIRRRLCLAKARKHKFTTVEVAVKIDTIGTGLTGLRALETEFVNRARQQLFVEIRKFLKPKGRLP